MQYSIALTDTQGRARDTHHHHFLAGWVQVLEPAYYPVFGCRDLNCGRHSHLTQLTIRTIFPCVGWNIPIYLNGTSFLVHWPPQTFDYL